MILEIKKDLLLILCFLYFVFHGKSNKVIKEPKKVVVMQMAKLGDMVCTTPMFRAIKETYPSCEVWVVGNRINRELLETNNDVDHYMVFLGFWDFFKKIRMANIDFACNISPSFINLSLLYLSGIKSISTHVIENGYSPYEDWRYKILRNFVIKKKHKMGSYAPREYLKLLEPLGVYTKNTTKYLGFSKEADLFVGNLLKLNELDLKKDLLVGISPSAGNKIKQWPAERFAEVANYINQKYNWKIVILGGVNDKKEVSNMINYISSNTKYINIQGKLSIDQLKALISKLNLFISVDTGPIYIAESFGIPTIDIVGPMDENEQPPIGCLNEIVVSKRSSPQLHIMNSRDYDYLEAKKQVLDISIRDVFKKIDGLMINFKQVN